MDEPAAEFTEPRSTRGESYAECKRRRAEEAGPTATSSIPIENEPNETSLRRKRDDDEAGKPQIRRYGKFLVIQMPLFPS